MPISQGGTPPTPEQLDSLKDLIDGGAATNFQLIKSIGEGAFSSVYLGCYKDNPDKLVAIKRIAKDKAFHEMNLANECRTMRKLGRHPNILSYFGLYTSKTSYHVASEYMEGGELLDILIQNFDSNISYSEAIVALMMSQITSAVAHCHRNFILHRDLKPENVLVRRGTKFDLNMRPDALRVSDFGLAVDFKDKKGMNSAGTTNYMSPERLKRRSYDSSSDIWSVGVIMYILLAGQFPFFGSDAEIFRMVNDPNLPNYNFACSAPCLQLLKGRLLSKFPEKRPSADELLEHPWMTGKVASTESINSTMESLRLFNAKNKFRATIRALMATKRLEGILSHIRTERISLELVEFGVSFDCVMKLVERYNEHIVSRLPKMSVDEAVFLDKHEFSEIFQKVLFLPDPTICEELFSSFQNKNSKVDPRVVCVSLVTKLKKGKNEILDAVFEIFDLNGDGDLQKEEFINMLSAMIAQLSSKPVDESQLEEEFNAADTDGNGSIDRQEFIACCQINHRIVKYLDTVEDLLANTMNQVRARIQAVHDTNEGFMYIKGDGVFGTLKERFVQVDEKGQLCWWDSERQKKETPKFCIPLKDADIWVQTADGNEPVVDSEDFDNNKSRTTRKLVPRFELNKKYYELKSYKELNAWTAVMKSKGANVNYIPMRKSSLLAKLTKG